MSDLLLMASSPLRSLLSTPGLVACYLPYMDGSGQSLTDWSGQGNHAQLGSTAGVDANDPSWGGSALVFEGDDGCSVPSLGTGSFTAFAVFKRNTVMTETYPRIFVRNNIYTYLNLGQSWRLNVRIDGETIAGFSSSETVLPNTWYLGVVRLNVVTGAVDSTLSRGVFSKTTIENIDTTYTGYSNSLGAHLFDSHWLEGSIAAYVMFNRVLTDAEVSKTQTRIMSLMALQGVTIA